MKKTVQFVLIVAAVALFLASCSTYTCPAYSVNPQDVNTTEQANG